MKKVDARSISSSAQEHLRQLAVKAVLDAKKQKEVAQLFGVTPQTICVWVKAYRLQGANTNQKMTPRDNSKLTPLPV
jgi:transposase